MTLTGRGRWIPPVAFDGREPAIGVGVRSATGSLPCGWRGAPSQERVPHLQEWKLPEIGVVRVQAADPVLSEQCREMSIRHKIATSHHALRDLPVGREEYISLSDGADPGSLIRASTLSSASAGARGSAKILEWVEIRT